MKAHDRSVLHSSAESDHRTPQEAYAALDAAFDFTVDLCANKASALCRRWHGPGSPYGIDGLTAAIGKGERIFSNPPYSGKQVKEAQGRGDDPKTYRHLQIENWVERHWELGQTNLVVAIYPASIQTEWWCRYVMGQGQIRRQGGVPFCASEVWHTPYRWKFLKPDGSPADNTAAVNHTVVIWRPDPGYVQPWGPVVRYWSYR